MDDYESTTASTYEDDMSTQVYLDPLLDINTAYIISLALKVMVVIFGVLGVISNLINLIVYKRMGLTSTSNINFFALSVADLLQCVYALVLITRQRVEEEGTGRLRLSYSAVLVFVFPLIWSAGSFGSWATAFISIERCVSVMVPLKVKQVFTRTSVTVLQLLMTVYQLGFLIPIYFGFHIRRVNINSTTADNATISYSELDIRKFQESTAIRIAPFSMLTAVCFIAIVIGTVLLVVKLRQTGNTRAAMTKGTTQSVGQTRREMTVSKVVVLVSAIYIGCMAPSVIMHALSLILPRFNSNDPYYSAFIQVMIAVFKALQTLSASVNILVYVKLSSRYRETLKSILCY